MNRILVAAVLWMWGLAQTVYAGNDGRPSERELRIENGQRSIYGIESVAEGDGPKGIAIISHGFNGSHHFGRDYFDTLNSLGYNVYVFDFPCGGVNSLSDNDTRRMSVLDEKNDLKAVVRHFLARPDIDSGRVVLIGESQGGLVSTLAASEMADTVSRLVLIYPALTIPEIWNNRYPKEADIPEVTYVWDVPVGKRFFQELHGMDAYARLEGYKGPVLIIHGSDDTVIPVASSVKAERLCHTGRLHVIPGAGHGFNAAERELSNRYVRQFLSDASR